MKKLIVLLICMPLLYSCTKHPSQHFIEATFGLGTNATIAVHEEVPVVGAYEFLIEFTGVDRKLFVENNWSNKLDVDFHLLVKTNGQTAIDTRVSKLELSHINDEKKYAAYFLMEFSLLTRQMKALIYLLKIPAADPNAR